MFPERYPLTLSEILVLDGVITEEHIARALIIQESTGGTLGQTLFDLGYCADPQVRETLSRQMGVNVIDLSDFSPSEELLELIPTEVIRKYELIPIKLENNRLQIAMTDPYNITAMAEVKSFTHYKNLEVVACDDSDYTWFQENFLEIQTVFEEILRGSEFYDKALKALSVEGVEEVVTEEVSPDEVQFAVDQAPTITLCNFLLVEAIKRRASDLHIEPYEEFFRLRLRIDGRLQTLLTPPKQLYLPIISRIKVMCDMDITKTRVPQDGHISIRYQGDHIDYRVSTLPTIFGEKCVIRVLKKQFSLMDLDKIGFDSKTISIVKRIIRRPQGLVLVTGPTGSGKTTTLHSALNEINDVEMNIVTLEDPCETSIAGINHVQIHERGGVSFSSGLRSILRQDPDVVFVGEMRDKEVSQITIRAALTGHLVMSTLHTNSAGETLTRLVDLGIPGYLLCTGLLLIIAQRLVRLNCNRCAVPYKPTPSEIKEFRLTPEMLEGATLRKGPGCPNCRNSGYRGRTAVYEVLEIDEEIREMIRVEAPASGIVKHARSRGMQTIFEAGVDKALAGVTTLGELRRVLSDVH